MSLRPDFARPARRVAFVSFAALVTLAPALVQAAPFVPLEPVFQTATNEFEGTFDIRIADRLDGTSDLGYWLITDWEAVRLDVTPDQYTELQRRAVIRVKGDRTGPAAFHVESLELITPPPAKLIDADKLPARRVATIMVHFGNPDGSNKEDFKLRMFTGETGTNTYYQQISYGKEKLQGNVFGWFEIPQPTNCDSGTQLIASQAQAAMKAEGYPTHEFTQFMYYFPNWGSCGWAGLASVGAPDDTAENSWYNGSFGCVVRAQEIGHNYGMLHSHSYSCTGPNGSTPYSDDCTSSEYGSPYDPMGGGCGHMAVQQKGFMGWLEECNTVQTSADGTFNLMPTELPCNGTQALKIPIDDDLSYYLEYRRPIGDWDGNIGASGVLVHVASDYDDYYFGDGGPTILDMNSGSGMFMHAGDSYDDHLGRVTFAVTEENATHAVIEVTYPNGGDGADPTCQDGATVPPTEAGAWGVLECDPEPIGLDEESPTVVITYPVDQQVFEVGASFAIEVDAMDDREVTDVELYLNGEVLFKDLTSPWSFWVDGIPEGTYELGVIAQDGTNWTASDAITIYAGTAPPDPTTGGDTDTGTGGATATASGTTTDSGGETSGTTDGSGTTGDTDGGSDSGNLAGDDGGCGCSTDGDEPPVLAFAGVVLAGMMRRRRRS